MAVNDVFKMALIHTYPQADGELVITHHYRQRADGGVIGLPALPEDLFNTWVANALPAYLDSLSDLVTLERAEIRGITNPLYGFDGTIAQNGDRLSLGAGSPVRTAPVVAIGTGLIGRSYRGRNFLMPPANGDLNESLVIGALAASIEAYYAAAAFFIGATSNNQYGMTVYSPKLSEAGPIVDNLAIEFVVRPRTGSVRGRGKVSG